MNREEAIETLEKYGYDLAKGVDQETYVFDFGYDGGKFAVIDTEESGFAVGVDFESEIAGSAQGEAEEVVELEDSFGDGFSGDLADLIRAKYPEEFDHIVGAKFVVDEPIRVTWYDSLNEVERTTKLDEVF